MPNLALVVEDDTGLQTIYKQILTDAGFEVQVAVDGSQAIERLDGATPSVIFLDILLPRVSGKKVLDHIARTPHLRDETLVVIVSSNRHEFDEAALKAITHVEFIQKPILPGQIRQLAQQVKKTLA